MSNQNQVIGGHNSHKSLESLQIAKENSIAVFCFPAYRYHHVHFSNIIQLSNPIIDSTLTGNQLLLYHNTVGTKYRIT